MNRRLLRASSSGVTGDWSPGKKTPSANRGSALTDMLLNQRFLKGGEKMQNEISIDWLSFTIPLLNPDDLSLGNIERIKHELLLNSEIQPMIKNGRYSYTSAIEYSEYYTILYNDVRGRNFEKGDPSLERFLKMGIHFEFSGNGCKRLVERLKESSMDIREYLLFLSQYGVKFARIDIAYDDYKQTS